MPLDWAGAWSVVMRWDLSSEGCRFKSQYSILDGLFENIFIIKIVCLKCLFEKTKVNEKEAGDGKGRHVLCWLSYNMMQSVVFKCETVFYVKPPTTNLSKTCFKKLCQHRPLFLLFSSFQTTIITIFTTNICEKISIHYMVLWIEPTTFGTWVSSHNHF